MSKNAPQRPWRKLAFAGGFLTLFSLTMLPAVAQGISLMPDTETEEMLKNFEAPLAKAAGLAPGAVRVYLVDDPSVNSFVAEGQNMFIQSGMILYAKNANELIGVMAHETGHIKAGHLSRNTDAMQKASVPMLLGLIVGIAAMMAGAGEAGMAIMGAGQSIAEGQINAYSRVQESTADQIALQLLNATHQSPMGIYNTFVRFASEDALNGRKIDPFAVNHPIDQDRVVLLQAGVDASPYKDVKDPPQVTHTFEMVQAKLAGFVLPVQQALNIYPPSNTSEPARYARAMIYLRKPDLPKALAETNSLIQDEPGNPYFYEVLGQIYLSMARPDMAIPAYQKSVDLKPAAPLLRQELAVAQLATDNAAMAAPALENLKASALAENDDPFTWYETAQAYSLLKNQPMANLATAEFYYNGGDMGQAGQFASRARRDLTQGSPEWQQANDIIGAAGNAARQQ